MMFALRSLADDSGIVPMQASEAHCQGNPSQARGGGRAASLSNRNFVFDLQGERRDGLALRTQHLTIGSENQMIVDSVAGFCISPLSYHGKVVSSLGVNLEKQVKGECGSIEGRTQIGGSRRKAEFQMSRS